MGVKSIAVVGLKGGTGKTTIAHALAYGANWLQTPSYVIHTDNRRFRSLPNRTYGFLDGRDPQKLTEQVKLIHAQYKDSDRDVLIVYDGGGNRPDFDKWISQYTNLVLMPVLPSDEDVDVAMDYLEEVPDAHLLINRMPTNVWEKESVERYIQRLPQEKIIARVKHSGPVRHMLDGTEFTTGHTGLNNFARELYHRVNLRLKEMAEAA